METQLIQVSNPIGQGGTYFTYALCKSLGYDYWDIENGPWLDYELIQNPDSNYSDFLNIVQLLMKLTDPYAYSNISEDLLDGDIDYHGRMAAFNFVYGNLEQMVKFPKGKLVKYTLPRRQNELFHIIFRNEWLPPYSWSPKKPNLHLVTDCEDLFKKYNIVRFNRHTRSDNQVTQSIKELLYDGYRKSNFKWDDTGVVYVSISDIIEDRPLLWKKEIMENKRLDESILRSEMKKWFASIQRMNLNR